MKEIRIYLGRYDKDGEFVEENKFLQFLVETINPRFSGYTILPCQGVWEGKMEPSTIIEIVTNEEDHIFSRKISEISQTYIKLFNQESVLVTYKDVEVPNFLI